MKLVNIQTKLNRAEKAIVEVVKRAYKQEQDIVDHIGIARKEFIKLRNDTKDLIIFDEPIGLSTSYWDKNVKRSEDIK